MRRQAIALLVCATASINLGHVASAADIAPRAAPAPVPMAAPAYNWTGFYVGVHAGWVWSELDGGVVFLPPALSPAPLGVSLDADGGMLGGQIGFNYQIANWVVGLEADLSWTGVDGSFTAGPLGVAFPGSSYRAAFDMNWFGTARARLGFAANNFLIYATGGFAFADVDYSVGSSFPGLTVAASLSETRTGWTIGGGVEWGFAPNWSVKAEYLYYDLGDVTLTAVSTPPGVFSDVNTFDNTGHILRVGLNYRFGWSGPVVARY